MPLVEIAFNNTRARLRSPSEAVCADVDGLLAYYAPGFRFMPKYKAGFDRYGKRKPGAWDGKIRPFSRRYGSFPAGLVSRVVQHLSKDHEVRLYDRRERPTPHPRLREGQNSITLRESQQEAAETGVEATKGVFEAATGWGKTCLMGELITKLAVPTLILVHRKELAYQTLERFEETLKFPRADAPFGLVGDSRWTPGLITIATYQTLYSMLERDRRGMEDWLDQFKALYCDEAHHVPARTLKAVCDACQDAFWRFGFSATPFKSDKASEVGLVSVTGDIIYSFGAQAAIEEGILVPPRIFMIDAGFDMIDGNDPLEGRYIYSWGKEYKDGIVEHHERNALLARCAEQAALAKQPTLVLLQHLAQGRNLLRHLDDGDGQAEFYHGSHATSARQDGLRRLAQGKLPILISSVIFEEGVDIPTIGALVLAGGYKAQHKAIQRVGRGLRAAAGKSHVVIFDLWDSHSERLLKHSRSRTAAYKKAGFEVEKVTPEQLWRLMQGKGFWGGVRS